MNKLFSRVILSLTVFAGGIFPISAVADLSGSQSGIPGVDYPIIPGVNAPPATGPVESLTGMLIGPTLAKNIPDMFGKLTAGTARYLHRHHVIRQL